MDERFTCPLCLAAIGHRKLPDDSREPLRRHLAGMGGPHRLRLEVAKAVVEALIAGHTEEMVKILHAIGLEPHPDAPTSEPPVPVSQPVSTYRPSLPYGWAFEDWVLGEDAILARTVCTLAEQPDPVMRRAFIKRVLNLCHLHDADLGPEPSAISFSRPVEDFFRWAFAPGIPADSVAEAMCGFIEARFGVAGLGLWALPRNDNGTYRNPAEWTYAALSARTQDAVLLDVLLRFAEVASHRVDVILAGASALVLLDVRLESEFDGREIGALLSAVERQRLLGAFLSTVIHPMLHHGASASTFHISLNRAGAAAPGFVGLTWADVRDIAKERNEWRNVARYLDQKVIRDGARTRRLCE